MAVYGFTVDVDGNVLEVMKQIENAVTSMGGKVDLAVNKAERGFESMGGKVDASLTKIKNSILGVFGVVAGLEGIKSFLKLGSDMEQTGISFEVMLGSASKAKAMIADLQQEANVTPFESKDLFEGGKLLLNFGVAADSVKSTLHMLGDAAGGNADRFKQMTLAYSQIQSAGKLTGQDLLQLINAGFNPLQEISIKTGKSMATLKDEMADGAISAKMVEAAFRSATGPGGKFFQMMDKQSQTLGGKWSSLMDSLQIKLIDLFDSLKPVFNNIIDGINALIPEFNTLMNEIKDVFQSAPVQFFLAHIKDMISLLLKIIPIWVSYKVAMLAVNAAQSIQSTITSRLIPLFRAQTTALEGSSAAAGAFKAQLISTGIGAFAVAIGLIVEKLSAMNEEFMESIEKISHIKELAGKDKGMQTEYKQIEDIMNAGIVGLNKDQRAEVYDRINKLMKANEDAIAMNLMPAIKSIDRRMDEIPDIKTNAKKLDKATGQWQEVTSYTKEEKKLRENKSSLLDSYLNYNRANESLAAMKKDLENAGVNPGGGVGSKGGYKMPSGDLANAYNTSALGGARGGLGEAKVVNIKIDTMQKIVTSDNKQLKAKGQDAVEVMLRTLNNIAYNQSSQ